MVSSSCFISNETASNTSAKTQLFSLIVLTITHHNHPSFYKRLEFSLVIFFLMLCNALGCLFFPFHCYEGSLLLSVIKGNTIFKVTFNKCSDTGKLPGILGYLRIYLNSFVNAEKKKHSPIELLTRLM